MILAKKGSLFFSRPSLMDYCSTRDELLKSSESLFNFIIDGLNVNINNNIPLDQVEKAHKMLESRSTTGSTILIPS